MFGLLYPAVLGSIFYSLLPTFSSLISRKQKAKKPGLTTFKLVAGWLVVLHFVIDFQLANSIPPEQYSYVIFILDLLVALCLYLAFEALNLGGKDPIGVRAAALAMASTYVLFLLVAFVLFESLSQPLLIIGVEVAGLALFLMIAAARRQLLLCLSLALMSLLMAYFGSKAVVPLQSGNASAPAASEEADSSLGHEAEGSENP